MKVCSLISLVCLLGLLAVSEPAIAQNLDANWLAGKWQGETQAPRARPSQVEILVKGDGTFTGEFQSQAFGLYPALDGKWEIAGDTVTFSYRTDFQAQYAGRLISASTWTLKRNGENLEGKGLNQTVSFQWDMKLKRSK
jgi:hypothetical protein